MKLTNAQDLHNDAQEISVERITIWQVSRELTQDVEKILRDKETL
jgi:hypothetical protein